MSSRRIALFEVGTDAERAFRSMLEVLSGRTRCPWQLVDAVDEANVVVTTFSGGHSALADWQSQDKPVLAIVESGDLKPRTPYVLTHPFRVMQVLSVLDEIGEEVAPHALPARPAPACAGTWDFAESVRRIAETPSPLAWLCSTTTHGADVLVAGNLRSFACDAATLQQIRDGQTVLSALAPAALQKVPLRHERRPGAELLWFSAWHASAKLAPWLDGSAVYRIRRWPDFGAMRPSRTQLRIAAAMAARPRTRGELGRLEDMPKGEVDRLLNALSLCGLLATGSADGVRGGAAPQPAGFMRSLIGSLRRTLHLGR